MDQETHAFPDRPFALFRKPAAEAHWNLRDAQMRKATQDLKQDLKSARA